MYREKIVELLKENMTEKGFKLWEGIDLILPNIWELPTSSTGKWHKKMNGKVPSNAEHVYEMLYAASKIFRLFDISKQTPEADKIMFSIVLHDSLKYGNMGNRKHTDSHHDQYAANMIATNKNAFLKLLTEEQFYTLEESVRFHSGQWSTDVPKNKKFSFKNYNPETLFLHVLDMLSSQDCLQTDVRE